jgi:N-acetylmuramoyl-L-alanine amidase
MFKKISTIFIRIFFLIILTFFSLTTSYFISDIKDIFADDNGNSEILICIDPGHGGYDVGAIGPTGLREKDVNLDIALRLRDKLIDAGFKIILTRKEDIKISLEDIVNFANTNNADIFISIHNNSHFSSDKKGTETFYFNDVLGGNLLANCINTRIVEQTDTINRGVKTADFVQLMNTKMVSALVEGAFISNPDEEAKLNDSGFRDMIAEGIYKGITEYLNMYGTSIVNNKDDTFNLSVLNGVGTRGIAAKTSELLKQIKYLDGRDKYMIDEIADAFYRYDRTQIICKSGDAKIMDTAEEIKAILNVGIITIRNGYQDSDIVIIIGKDYIPLLNGVSGLYQINIQNGNGILGIATRLKNKIEKEFANNIIKVTEAKDAENFNYKNTRIIIFSKKDGVNSIAEYFHKSLSAGEIIESTNNIDNVDIAIILGGDYKE